jgi:uncharacterized membrane protein
MMISLVSLFLSDTFLLEKIFPFAQQHYAIGSGSVQGRQLLFLSVIKKCRLLALGMGMAGVALMFFWSWVVTRSTLPEQRETPVELLAGDVAPRRAGHWLLLGAICLLALWLRVLLIQQSLWMDELTAVVTSVKRPSLWEAITQSPAASHFAYSLLARLSIALLGESEVSLRLPALIFGLLSLVLTYYLASRLFDPRVGLVASFLTAVAPIHFFYSQSARGYTALMVFALLSVLFFLRGVERQERRQWVYYSLLTTLGFTFHLFIVWVVACQLILFGFMIGVAQVTDRLRNLMTKQLVTQFFTSLLAVGVIVLMIYGLLTPRALKGLFVTEGGPGMSALFPSLLGSFSSSREPGLSSWLYLGLAAIGWGGGVRKRGNPILLIGMLIALPPVLALIPGPAYLSARFFLFGLPFYLILVASGVAFGSMLVNRLSTPLVISTCLALGAFQIPTIRDLIRQELQDFRAAGEYLSQVASPDTAICAIGIGSRNFAYYVRNGQVVIPRNLAQFQELVQTKKAVYCAVAYRPRSEEVAEHRRIFDYLEQNAVAVKTFDARKPISVYVLREAKTYLNSP